MRSLALVGAFLLLAASSALATPEAPSCFKFQSFGQASCRQEAATALVGGTHFLVWGGLESHGCAECSRMVYGANSGGLYDAEGNLVEAMALTNGPGPRVGAQGLWNGAAFFVWGGMARRGERWIPATEGGEAGHHEIVSSSMPSFGAFYIPGIRQWTRMSQVDSPSSRNSRIELGSAGEVRVCGADGCKSFDMIANTWGPLQ